MRYFLATLLLTGMLVALPAQARARAPVMGAIYQDIRDDPSMVTHVWDTTTLLVLVGGVVGVGGVVLTLLWAVRHGP